MSLPKSISAKGGKRGGPWWGPSRRSVGKPSEKTPTSSKLLGEHISKCIAPTMIMRGSYDLSQTFQEMATSAGLIGSEVHEVQEVWTGQNDLWATYHVVKDSPKGIQFCWVVPLTKSPKIIRLRGIKLSKALHRQMRLSFCLWCGVYYTTSADAMHCH